MEIHDGLQCFGGFIYVDPRGELEKRGLDPDEHPRARFMKPCPFCAVRGFRRHFGGAELSWENWRHREELAEAVERFRSWYPRAENQACLILSPDELQCEGNGKTHVLSATGIAILRAGRRCRFWNAADLAEHRFEPWLDTVAEQPGYVLIDDLGNEPDNAMNRDAVDRLLDSRYRHRRPTLVATRLSRAFLERDYPRFMARMRSGTIIEWKAERFARTHP